MSASPTEYDKRQLHQMSLLTDLAREGKKEIFSFVSDQWALLNLLESVPSEWKENFREKVNQVEQIFSLAESESCGHLTRADVLELHRIFDEMKGEICKICSVNPLP